METSEMQDFLVEQLRILYDAEKQLIKALPKMAKAASDEELADGFRQHVEQTKEQAGRIEQIFQSMGVKARAAKCAPMQGLIEDGQRIMSQDMADGLRDAALTSAGRAVEHFEMACYDSLLGMARVSKQDEIAQLLQETLREETETERKLATISKRLLKEFMSSMSRASSGSEEEDGQSRSSSRSVSRSRSGSSGSRSASARGGQASSGRSQGASSSRSRSGSSGNRGSGHLGQMTTDHDEIRQWAEERGGKPACVMGTGGKGDIGMLRIEFPGKPNAKDAKLQEINWDEFFEKFDERGLALVYQDKTSRGQVSNFNKLVSRETEKTRTVGER
jgi:ferritin-like metal-binding protein YciE